MKNFFKEQTTNKAMILLLCTITGIGIIVSEFGVRYTQAEKIQAQKVYIEHLNDFNIDKSQEFTEPF